MNRKQVFKVAFMLAIMVGARAALAADTGAEFEGLYNWINGIVTGYFGKAIAVAAVGIGAIMSVARVNPIPVLSGVGFAVFEQYTPTIISGILTATI